MRSVRRCPARSWRSCSFCGSGQGPAALPVGPLLPAGHAGLRVAPDDIRSLRELASLPFTTKRDFRDNYPFGLLAVRQEEIARMHVSGGTTGKPILAVYAAADIELWAEMMARTLSSGGVGHIRCSPCGLHLRTLHRQVRLPLRSRAGRRRRDTRLQRPDETADHADPGPGQHGTLLHPLLRPLPGRNGAGDGRGPAGLQASRRFLRRRALV